MEKGRCFLSEIQEIDIDTEYAGVDPKIRKLVYEINQLGVETFWSCEGHKSPSLINKPFPAIGIMIKDLSPPAIFRLFELVGYFDENLVRSFGPRWYFEPHHEYLMLRPQYHNGKNLEELQTQAKELAELINKVRNREKTQS